MNADDVRKVLLLRAFESPTTAPWTEADATWASAETARLEGEAAAPDRWIARRADIALQRLAERVPATTTALAADRRADLAWLLVPLAFACGAAIDAIGPTGRLNIIALPLLGVLAWNLAVYLLLAWQALRGGGVGRLGGWLHARVMRVVRRGGAPEALARYAADWTRVGAPLHAQRLAAVLHAAAAALALGLLASLYVRGLAFEYRAGWDSTFLGPEDVQRLLSVVLTPALTLTDSVLPSAEHLAALRFSDGPGENAAPWIHLLALTVLLVVLLPRNLLVAWAAWRAQRLQKELPLALDAPYFRRLLPARHATRIAVRVLPYSYKVDAALQAGLQAALERALDADVALQLADSLPLGGEDTLDDRLAGIDPHTVLMPLLALTATPERETHGAFLSALAARRRDDARALVPIDESGFRAFDEARRAQRRAAWRSMLSDLGLTPLFVDLASGELVAVDEGA
ncbi:DUF2868 domain-containing protein [uncultured Methylibium sp.]|uniref:DUF2868 domain-containing protein n=1 Tax=uncultured Methylibium sp. TaxID=381093 RepID=UPI0025CF6BB3|nr:DUF2868 domain-containing protein [uncultured Methylibium sp.]